MHGGRLGINEGLPLSTIGLWLGGGLVPEILLEAGCKEDVGRMPHPIADFF